ncbi:FecR family protein [Chitinophaga solisilvae]|uniref:FecR family protein n=1 Tax=Chitinophaga solisilvae TaxID=1233460 RepID=UPI00136B1ECF|nr:FecR family protein [Chitinophaga solisilvae]
MMNQTRLEELFALYYNRTATPAQIAELMALLEHAPPETLEMLIMQNGEKLADTDDVIARNDADNILQQILRSEPAPVQRRYWRPYAMAAAVSGLLLGAAYLWLHNRQQSVTAPVQVIAADMAPGKEHATLTLGDASVIALDTASNGLMRQQGNAAVRMVNKQLVYTGHGNGDVTWNTISTGRGNHYSLVLSDGTRVWLNAATSLRFPAAFTGKERAVEVSGEAYFEVARDAGRPFRVQLAGHHEITVLGTSFNVHAYNDEDYTATTLVSGCVKINNHLLRPGQQARTGSADNIAITYEDTEQAIAWKNGYFWFEDVSIHVLMKQIARWYDVEVRFEGNITEDGFSGRISRDLPLSKVLQILSLNDIHFKINGRQVTVMP